MYEELVEALRLCVKYGKADDALANSAQAAEAIEEQSVEIEKLKKKVRSLQNKVDSLKSAASWDEDIRRRQFQGMW